MLKRPCIKKSQLYFCTVLLFFVMSLFFCVKSYAAEADVLNPDNRSSLPASLKIIDEEAFEGTSLTTLAFPESVEVIEHRAFEDIKNPLLALFAGKKEFYIAKDAFKDTSGFFYGISGSFVKDWAQKNGFLFFPLNTFFVGQSTVASASYHERIDRFSCCFVKQLIKRHPDRLSVIRKDPVLTKRTELHVLALDFP